MALDKTDKKEITEIIQSVVEKSIMPEFKTINRKLDATMEMTAQNSEDITMLREDISDNGFTLERIETKLDSTVRRQDDASVKTSQLQRRVLKLETKATR